MSKRDHNWSWVGRILSSLAPQSTDDELATKPVAPADPKARPTHGMAGVGELEARLASTLAGYADVSAGRVRILSFDELKAQVGGHWQRFETTIRFVIEQGIERHLDDGDFYARCTDDSYVLVFTGDHEESALNARTALIRQHISGRLVGKEDCSRLLEIRHAAIKRDGVLVVPEPHTGDDLTGLFAEEADPTEMPPNLKRILDETAEENAKAILASIHFLFRPMWSARRRVISAYLCLPARRLSEDLIVTGTAVLPDNHGTAMSVDLDALTIERVGRELQWMDAHGILSLVSFPLGFESLASQRFRKGIVTLLARLVAAHRQRIVIELTGLPDGVTRSRLVELVTTLKPFCRAVAARVPPDAAVARRVAGVGLVALGCEIATHTPDAAMLTRLLAFQQEAARHGLLTYGHGVRDRRMAAALVRCGFDFVDGDAIGTVAPHTMAVQHFEPKLTLSSPLPV